MPWLPDHIWLAQKAAKAAGGGAKGGTKKTTPVTKKSAPVTQTKGKTGGQDITKMIQMMLSDPGKQQAFKKMMGVTGGASPKANKGAVQQPEAPSGNQAKMFLAQFLREKTGEAPTKDTIAYTTTEVEGAKPPQFISEVILLPVDPSKSYKGKAAPSKKAAEANAAEAALRQNGKGAMLKGGGAKKPAAPKMTATKKKTAKEGGKKQSGPDVSKVDADKKVWVGNLTKGKDTSKELNELFKTVGKVTGVKSMGKNACVVFGTAAEATLAIATLQGSMIGGNAIEVDVWTTKEK